MRFLFWLVPFLLLGCVTIPETGRSVFVLRSERDEARLGEEAYREILSKENLSKNSRWNALLQRVGKRIAFAARKPSFQWEFRLIESAQQNAFCLPGGKVAFYTGIFRVAQHEAGIATVMGHEVAHATARHGGQRIALGIGAQLGMTGLMIALGEEQSTSKNLILAALGVGTQVGVMLPFSRSNESEADEIGLIYMARAGYDPREAPKFWERFSKKGGSPPEFLSTHPSSRGRMEALNRDLAKVMPIYERSSKFGTGETLY